MTKISILFCKMLKIIPNEFFLRQNQTHDDRPSAWPVQLYLIKLKNRHSKASQSKSLPRQI